MELPIEPMEDNSVSTNQTWIDEGTFSTMQLNRHEMNQLIIEYLVHEGFKEAAERFREEAGIAKDTGEYLTRLDRAETGQKIDRRIKIREMIEAGDMMGAQTLINQFYPELLDNHEHLIFKLRQQHIIELIRQQRIDDVLNYVQHHLSGDQYKDAGELEKTLALLAYENPDKSPYLHLLHCSRRLQLASEINDVILRETVGDIESSNPRLVTLMKLLIWTQNELEKKRISHPKMTDILNGTISHERYEKKGSQDKLD